MRINLKRGLIATSLALAFGSFGCAYAADIIQFDPDGTGGANGAFSVGAFDWAVASVVADQANVTAPPAGFNTYFHTALQGFQDTGGNPSGAPTGINSAFEITVVGGFGERISNVVTGGASLVSLGANGVAGGGDDVYAVTQTASFAIASTGTNFVRIYFDNFTSGLKSDALSGLHYDDGKLILSARIDDVSGSFGATQRFVDVNGNGIFDSGIDTPLGRTLDLFGIDNWGGQQTVQSGDGSTTLTATVDSFDPTFFLTALSKLTQDLNFTTQLALPFQETNPSQSFDTDDTTNPANVISLGNTLLALGLINSGFLGGPGPNGTYGPDTLFQADASTSFARAVPEPSALALLGIGLMGLAASRRKARS